MSDDEHTGMRGTMDRAVDKMGGLMGRGAAATTGGNLESFVHNAAIGDLYEIEAGRIARMRSRNERIRDLAKTMIEDHQTASREMKAALTELSDAPQVPTELDGRRAQMIEHLEKAADEDFDGRYLEQQDMAHKETLTLFDTFLEAGTEQPLVRFAKATRPHLQRHLDAVRALRQS